MDYLQVVIEQGTPDNPKKEPLFLQFLDNLHNTAKGKHLSFELFGYSQYTYFFIGCEPDSTKLVEGLIYATFPNCEIRQMKDYTRFYDPNNQVLLGTSANLARSDIYPIKTFNEFEVDALSGVFSVISKLGPKDQAWVQMLISPKDDNWLYHLGRKVKMKLNRIFRIFRIKNYMRIKAKKEFYKEEDAHFVAKTDFNPFHVQFKFGAISDNTVDARKNILALAKAFYQFNKTDYNEFVMQKLKSGKSFLKEYQARKMTKPQTIGAHEVATLYHFPNADHVPHIVHMLAKKHEPPKNLPAEGTDEISMFGTTNYHNNFQDFGIKREDRRRHLYVVGKSGTGKSKMLELLIKRDILAGKGVGVLDPHGDLVDNIMRVIPEHRMKDVIYFDPGDTEFPIAFNPLEKVDEKFKMQITIGFISIYETPRAYAQGF